MSDLVQSRIIATVAMRVAENHCGNRPIVTLDSDFLADIGFDDLDVVETIMEVEEMFCVMLDDNEPCATVRDLVALTKDALRRNRETGERQ